MWFKKKKDVDLRDLHKRGVIRVPKQDIELETDRNGFVDLNQVQKPVETIAKDNLTSQSETGFLNFFDTPASSPPSTNQTGMDLRDFTRRLEELDNKLYKIEQRIELLERKVGVGSSGYSWQ